MYITMHRSVLQVACTGLVIALASACTLANGDSEVNVTLFGESLCPYCARFTVDIMAPLFDEGLDKSVINFKYIAYGNAFTDTDGTITCQHGPAECAMNRVINCAQKLYPKQAQWFPFVNCLEAAAGPDIAAAAPQCAEAADLAWASVDKCASGPLGDMLDVEAEAATAALHPAHTYVPWVTVNGIPLGAAYVYLKTIVCAAYTGERPDACFQEPPGNSLSHGAPGICPLIHEGVAAAR